MNNKNALCSICKLNDTCQHNFDFECQETFDFIKANFMFLIEDFENNFELIK